LEWVYVDAFVADFEDGEGFGAARGMEKDFVVLGRSHEGAAEGRGPTDVVAVEVYFIGADDAYYTLCAGGVGIAYGSSEEGFGGALTGSGSFGVNHLRGFDSIGEKTNAAIDLAKAALAVLVVGVFTAIAIAGSPRYYFDHRGAILG
jgi:hypothetical protein